MLSAFFEIKMRFDAVFKDKFELDGRLLCAAGFVRRGARVCDIGTDHAYLPIFLCKAGIAVSALACDVNEGPCDRARKNVAANGCGGMIDVRQADGLAGAESFDPTDIVICGMGGELIFRIVRGSPLTKKSGVRLILQPMTKAAALRCALVSHGFEIVDEALVREDRIYQVIAAEYTGRTPSLSEAELLLGPVNLARRSPLLYELAKKHLDTEKAIRLNKKLHGVDHSREDGIVSVLEKIMEEKR